MPYIEQTTCCGIGDMDNLAGSSKDSIMDALRTARAENKGVVMATTLSKGYTKEIAFLKELEFTEVLTFKNPNSGNTVTMWVKDITKMKVKCRDCKKDIKQSTFDEYDGWCGPCYRARGYHY